MTDTTSPATRALSAADASVRLRAALDIGTRADPSALEALVARSGIEPDFFVRDMLTWALTRLPASRTVPRLVAELAAVSPQARAQALHTLSKIGDPSAAPAVARSLHASEDEVATTAWRAAVALVQPGEESALAPDLGAELGRRGTDARRSLSRALAALGEDAAGPVLDAAERAPDEEVRVHAAATRAVLADPAADVAAALEDARRVAAIGRGPIPGTA